MMIKKKRYILLFSTLYSLLIYLLYNNLETIKSTFFFQKKMGGGIFPCKKIKIQSYISTYNLRRDIHLIPYWLFINLKSRWYSIFYDEHIFTNDIYSHFVFNYIAHRPYTLIEDGIANYLPNTEITFYQSKNIFRSILKKFIFLKLNKNNRLKTIVTHPLNQKQCELISLQKLWDNSSQEKKQFIKDVYGINDSILSTLKGKTTIIFTQPLSEDGLISEQEKIQYYKNTLKSIPVPPDKIVIKTHPREGTNYKKIFPDIFIFNKNIPQEILNFCGVRFKQAYTISSTAAINFGYSINIIPIRTGKNLAGEDTFIKIIEQQKNKAP